MKVDSIEKDYWWEIKAYLEEPTKENLMNLLELVYEGGYYDSAAEHAEGFYDD